MESKKVAIIAGSVFIVILLLGVNGFSIDGEETGIPAITAPDQAFFSEEPLPTNPVPALVSAKVTITWSEEDIWLVIVDSDEKDRCSTAPSPFFDMCNSRRYIFFDFLFCFLLSHYFNAFFLPAIANLGPLRVLALV